MSRPLLARLRSDDPDERRAACAAMAQDPSAVLWVEALVGALGDSDRGVSRAASDALARIGARDPGTERALRDALHGESPRARWGAAFTLARLAPPEPGLIPAVVEAMGSPDGDVRWAAARLLVDMGRLHPEVVRVTLGLARGADDPAVRRMAVFCLRDLAPDEPAAARALVEATRDDRVDLRRAALTALAKLLDPPAEVWGRLIEAIGGESDPIARALAAAAAGELGARHATRVPDALRGALSAAAEGPAEDDLRRAAERSLARLEDARRTEGAHGP